MVGFQAVSQFAAGLGLSMDEPHRWRVAQRAIPSRQVFGIAVRGEAAEGVDVRSHADRLVMNLYAVVPIDEFPAERTRGLEPDDYDVGLLAP